MKPLPINKYLPGASKVIYGCMGLGGEWGVGSLTPQAAEQAHKVVDAALDAGINFFDHADIYRQGKAESAFGKVLGDRKALRESIFIQSKCGIRFEDALGPKRYDFSSSWINRSITESLQRLNTDYVDVYLLHRPDPLMQPEELAEVFQKLLARGAVRFFGVSNMHQHHIDFLQSEMDLPLIVNQVEMSLTALDWLEEGVFVGNSLGSRTNFGPGTVEYCRKKGIQIQSWGSLSNGKLSGRDISSESPALQKTAELVGDLAIEHNTTAEAIILAWLLRHPANIQPIIGTTNLSRIRACAQATDLVLTREQWYALYISARGHALP